MITFAGSVHSVDLPNPTFGNTSGSSVHLSVRRTLSGNQKTYIVTSNEQQHNLTIPNILYDQKLEFEEMIADNDESLIYTDKDGQDWSGVITNFPFDMVETYNHLRSEMCIAQEEFEELSTDRRYSFTINFKGSKV